MTRKIRNRKTYLLFIVLIIITGLVSRTEFVSTYIDASFGDYLYAILFFLIFGFVFTKLEPYKILILSLIFCYSIEFLQIYQPNEPNWISFIRSYKVSRLVLGNNFQWNDIINYTFGGMTGYFWENLFYFRNRREMND